MEAINIIALHFIFKSYIYTMVSSIDNK
jgi:hypothetical protein